jgi:alpha-1,2-mannosyltransferase
MWSRSVLDTSSLTSFHAQDRFGIDISPSEIDFVFLRKRFWVESTRYPRFTMIGQSLGSVVLALEALLQLTPHVFVDTMGYAFSFPIFALLGGCSIGCYVHYPTISTDMLGKVFTRLCVLVSSTSSCSSHQLPCSPRQVADRESGFNNAGFIAKSAVLSFGKLMYYQLFARVYGFVGRYAQVCMTNSTWTNEHIIRFARGPCDDRYTAACFLTRDY